MLFSIPSFAIENEADTRSYCKMNAQAFFDNQYKLKVVKGKPDNKSFEKISELLGNIWSYDETIAILNKKIKSKDNRERLYEFQDFVLLLHYLLRSEHDKFDVNQSLIQSSLYRTISNAVKNNKTKKRTEFESDYLSYSLIRQIIELPQIAFMLIHDDSGLTEFNDNRSNEINFLKLALKERKDNSDLGVYIKDNSELDVKKYTASYIQEIYDKNEVKGDLKFKGKQFYVTGAIASIDSSINDQPAVHFATDIGNQFQTPTAFFKDYENKLEQIAELSKGQDIKLLCTGAGEVMGSPMLNDCEFSKSELDLYVDQIIKNNGDSVELKGGYDIDNLYLSVKTLSSVLPDDSACFNDDLDGCKNELFNIPNYKIRAAANRYLLSRDKIHAAMRTEIDTVNQEMIKKYNNSKEINQVIEFKEKCYVPTIMNLF
jgi:hypothetical protein